MGFVEKVDVQGQIHSVVVHHSVVDGEEVQDVKKLVNAVWMTIAQSLHRNAVVSIL